MSVDKRKLELEAIEQCPDHARCHMERLGLPICHRGCSIMWSYRHSDVWRNIQALAAAGNSVSQEIVNLVRGLQ
jgi:hypothetical protein